MLKLAKGLHSQASRAIPLSFELFKGSSASKQSIILLHGLFGSKKNYKSVGRKLSQKLDSPIYAVDLRNHGDSEHSFPFDYSSMTRDVLSFIKEHNLQDVTIIGHSMGAKVAMCCALEESINKWGRIKRLIAVDNSPVSKKLGLNFEQDLRGMYELEKNGRISKKDKNWRDQAMKFMETFEKDYKTRLFLLSNLTNKVGNNVDYVQFKIPVTKMYQLGLDSIGEFPSMYEGKAKFEGPSLFLKAKYSDFINDESIARIQEYFPNYELLTFDTGHWLISEDPDKFIDTTIHFIQNN